MSFSVDPAQTISVLRSLSGLVFEFLFLNLEFFPSTSNTLVHFLFYKSIYYYEKGYS